MTTFTPEATATLRRAIDTYGEEAQIGMIIEECAELIVTIRKIDREPGNPGRIFALYDELADVSIMLQQARMMFGEEAIDEAVKIKLDRLRRRLDKEDKITCSYCRWRGNVMLICTRNETNVRGVRIRADDTCEQFERREAVT